MLNINEKFLVGEKLLKIEVDKNQQHWLRLTTDKGVYSFFTEGDCCSETWFADINGPSLVLNKKISAVEELDLDKPDDERTRQQEDLAYSLKITTEGGILDIIYRNSSNGYYGGDIQLYSEDDNTTSWSYTSHNRKEELNKVEWEEIKEDWQATGNG